MNRVRFCIDCLVGGMLVFPLAYAIHNQPLASATPSSVMDPTVLVTGLPSSPLFEQIHKLNFPVIATYIVKEREDLWAISQRFHVDQFTIKSSNDLENPFPSAGTVLLIPNAKGTVYDVDKPENLQSITHGFGRGKVLGVAYDEQVLSLNGFPAPDFKDPNKSFEKGTRLFLPDAWKPTGLEPPFSLSHQTSGWGMRKHPVLGITRPHRGRDLAMPYGTPVPVTRPGTVTFAGWMGGYGNMVEIRHQLRNGHIRFTRYGHLSKIRVHEGQHVSMYQIIGNVGSTGISTGPHLHYEIRDEDGNAPNPNSKAAY
jgi:murein DD-endopeptidase MepM/ murein hydrolase activator NlpD